MVYWQMNNIHPSERTQEEGKKGPKSTYRDLRIMRYDAAEYQRQANAHRSFVT
jgi:hypothetical protein